MKILIITQKVDKNDKMYWGFFHRWLEEFSKNCEKLTVICLYEGYHNLPENVKILSLGKEKGISRIKYILNFYKYIWRERENYDVVFIHMNPIYLVLGGFFWKLIGKKTSLWYTHRNVDWKLRIAEKFTDVIFTASKESFQLKSNKIKVVGHGIPVEEFVNPNGILEWMPRGVLRIISIGRITPIKNLDTLIEAAKILKNNAIDFKITLIGGTMTESDKKYFEKLKEMIKKFGLEDKIIFAGGIQYDKIKEYYWKNDLSINLCPTGGVDKAVLESMAAGLPVLVSNRTFIDYFGKYGEMPVFKERDPKGLADKIMKLVKSDKIREIKSYFVEQIGKTSGLPELIKKITDELK